MVRAIFCAIGLFVTLCGGALLKVDQMVLSGTPVVEPEPEPEPEPEVRGMLRLTSFESEDRKVLDPPDWAAFSLMSIGTVTMLYSVALPKRK